MNRSEVRHALYRMKNGVPIESKKELYETIQSRLLPHQNWSNFTKVWDIYLDADKNIHVIKPESDFDFVQSTCIERAMCERSNSEFTPTSRQANIIEMVELNMLGDKMKWSNYNKTWSVSMDRDLKRISTKLFDTKVNEVTDEMISKSVKSDGAAMTSTPSLPEFKFQDGVPMSVEEIEEFEKNLKKTRKNKKKVAE